MRFSSLVLTAAIALTIAAPVKAAEYEWRFFTYVSPSDFHAKMNAAFAEDITKATGGRLKITHFAAGELPYKSGDVIKAVATNQIQMGQVGAGLAAGDAPEIDVFSVPFVCTTYAGFAAATKAIGSIPDEVLTKKFGVRVIMNWPIPGQDIWTTEQVTKIADLKGKKIRTWNPMQVQMLDLLGASAVSIDPAEVVPALQRKVVDGAITSALSANDWKAYDIVKYGFMLNFTMAHQITLVNADALAQLPEDLRKIVMDKSAEWAPRYFAESEKTNAAAVDNMRAHGVTMTEPTAEDVTAVKALLKPMWSEWAEANGEVAKTLLERVSAACK